MKVKKTVLALAGVLALLIVAGLVVPSFIDWNRYKSEIAAQVSAATGRELVIDGTLDVSFLPQPTLIAEDLRLSNMPGAAVADMVILGGLRVRLALWPLLAGKVEIASLTLIRPMVELELLSDGRPNWEFEPLRPAGEAQSAAAHVPASGRHGGAFKIGWLKIEDGTIVYRDSRTGDLERVDDIDAEIVLESAKGPVAAVGSAAPRGVPMRFEFKAGAFGESKPVPLSLVLDFDGGAARLDVRGELSKPDKDGAFEGMLHVEAADPVKFARNLFGGAQGTDGLPTALAQRVTLDSSVALSATRVSLAELSMAHGDSHAKGTIEASFGKTPRLDAKLAVDRLDLDAFLDSPQAPKSKDAKAKDGAAKTAKSKDRSKPGGKDSAGTAKEAQAGVGFEIPKDVAGGVDITIDSLVYNGGEVKKAHLVGTLGQGTLTITKAAASLPGATAMSASASLTARKNATVVDGTLNLASDDARALLEWLKIDLAGLPEDRLKKFNFAGRFSAAGEQIQLRDVNFAFDQSRLTGAATIALRKRLAFGANIALDRIDLDRYTGVAKPKTGSGETASGETAGVPPANPEAKSPSPLAALAPLEGFDANIQARIGQLGIRKMQAQGVVLDGTLSGGTLTLRDLSAQDFAGAALRMSGTLSGFSSAPQIKANLDIRAADAARLLRALGANSAGADKVGRLALVGSVNTNAKDANLDVALQLAGGTLRLQGPVKNLDADPRFELSMNADFPDVAALMRAFGSSSAARLGGLKLAGKGQGDGASVSLTGLKGNLGPIAIHSGEAKLGLGANKTKIMANLATGEIALDAFGGAPASAPSRAAAPGRAGAPGAGAAAAAAPGAQRWSREPIDIAGLKSFDGEFRVQSTAVRSGKLAVTNAALEATVLDGTLEVKNFTGRLFDGTLSVKGKVQASPKMEFALALDQFDINQALRTLTELDRATGKANLRFNLRATPKSEYDLIGTLAGNGTLDGTLAVKLRAEEAAGAALLGVLGQQLGQLQGISGLTNGLLMAFGSGQGQLKGSFLAERGVVRTNDLQLANPNATSRVTGQADLPQWLVDGQGTVTTGSATQPVFTVSAKGSLDQPALKFGGTGIQAGANPLQQLLPGLLGKPQQQQPQDPQQKKKITPQDVLKNILKQ